MQENKLPPHHAFPFQSWSVSRKKDADSLLPLQPLTPTLTPTLSTFSLTAEDTTTPLLLAIPWQVVWAAFPKLSLLLAQPRALPPGREETSPRNSQVKEERLRLDTCPMTTDRQQTSSSAPGITGSMHVFSKHLLH